MLIANPLFVILLFLANPPTTPPPAWATDSFVYSVAARCSGESSADVWECACTVRNRIASGWSVRKVLSAYYAPDVRPSDQAIDEARKGLHGLECSPDWYYLMSASDLRYLGWSQDDATGKADKVFMFERAQWGR